MATPVHTLILPIFGLQLPRFRIDQDPAEWYRKCASSLPTEARENLELAAAALQRDDGLPVAFPTETVYGLGANATSSAAVNAIYKAKNRPADNPLIVHIASQQQLQRLLGSTQIPEIYEPLIKAFWPGPLTIILPLPSASSLFRPDPAHLAAEITHGLPTFGARMPSSSLARLLIALADRPIAAPSANISGKPSPTTAYHVYEDFHGTIELILDGGPCEVGLESTVVNGLINPPVILRPGGVTLEQMRSLGGPWTHITQPAVDLSSSTSAPTAPGMKYRHYAPKGRVLLVDPDCSQMLAVEAINQEINFQREIHVQGGPALKHDRIAVFRTTDHWDPFLGLMEAPPGASLEAPALQNGDGEGASQEDASMTSRHGENSWKTTGLKREEEDVMYFHPTGHPKSAHRKKWICGRARNVFSMYLGPSAVNVARDLFSALRACDELGCTLIVVESISLAEGGVAVAVMERLRKAAVGK